MSNGAKQLLEKYKSRLAIAEALILGELPSYHQEEVHEVVSPLILEAARIRLQTMGLLTPEYILPA